MQKTFKACCLLTHTIDTLHYAYLCTHTHTNRNKFNRNVSYARGMHPAHPYSECHLSNEKDASTYSVQLFDVEFSVPQKQTMLPFNSERAP